MIIKAATGTVPDSFGSSCPNQRNGLRYLSRIVVYDLLQVLASLDQRLGVGVGFKVHLKQTKKS